MTHNFTRLSYVEATTANLRHLAGLVEVAYTKYQNNSNFHAPNISRLTEAPSTSPNLSEPVRMSESQCTYHNQNVKVAIQN